MNELNIEKANSRYVSRNECKAIKQATNERFESVDSRFNSMEKRLDRIDNRLWGLVLLAIAQLVGIAITLFKMVVR